MAKIQKFSQKELLDAKNNLQRFPYKGAITEIAKAKGVHKTAIWKAVHVYNNKAYLEMICQYANRQVSKIQSKMVG